jgi:hypothetical protein
MISTLLHLLRLFPFLCGGHRQLALETLALRQQLTVYRRAVARPSCVVATALLAFIGLSRERRPSSTESDEVLAKDR